MSCVHKYKYNTLKYHKINGAIFFSNLYFTDIINRWHADGSNKSLIEDKTPPSNLKTTKHCTTITLFPAIRHFYSNILTDCV
jgi:hypothetical protein